MQHSALCCFLSCLKGITNVPTVAAAKGSRTLPLLTLAPPPHGVGTGRYQHPQELLCRAGRGQQGLCIAGGALLAFRVFNIPVHKLIQHHFL